MKASKKDWKRLLELLDTFFDLDEAEREASLERLRQSEPELHSQLRTLLAQGKRLAEQDFLATPVGLAGAADFAADAATLSATPADTRPTIKRADDDVTGDDLTRDPPDRPDASREGELLVGRFRLLEVIGQGATGRVYSARDTLMQGEPLIAIKLLGGEFRKHTNAVTALERECRRVRMLAHENIVRVFEFYRSGDDVFITMELLAGETFDQLIKRFPQGVPFEQGWPLIRAAAMALAYSHRQSPPFIHYDFKPKNVFLTKQGRVKVLDFGVARAIRPKDQRGESTRLYETALPGLTLAYASCEMLAGQEPDPRDDVYSLSCFTYEVLSGNHPFRGVPADAARLACLTPPPIKALSEERNRALASGLAFERAGRTASVDALVAELDPPSEIKPNKVRAAWGAAALAGVLIVAVLMVAGAWFLRVSAPQRPDAALVPRNKVQALYDYLGVIAPPLKAAPSFSRAEVAQTVRTAKRRVTLGSTPGQIQAAFNLCRHFAQDCSLTMYADEEPRQVTLAPFQLQSTAVTVADFRKFVTATGYHTRAEDEGGAFALVGDKLRRVKGGTWRNAVASTPRPETAAVVAVTQEDARQYCTWDKQRLPTEDEWEYVARGPQRYLFPWGDDFTPAIMTRSTRPDAAEGPAGGIDHRYYGMSGNVWEWVSTQVNGNGVLKGGSWLETNPANKRSAARRTEIPTMADSDSGFRCAQDVPAWPDAEVWLAQLL
jgi:formylglycine-generating enzyme required for sulfatase activity